jgi:hypothetical protein
MKRILGGKFVLAVSAFLIIAFGAFLGVTAVAAQETEDIAPDQTFDIITLLQGQSATLSVSQSAPFGFHSVFVTSLGNKSIGAGLAGLTPNTMGWWTVMLIGYRSRTLVDFSYGLVPWSGPRATIDLTDDRGFGLVLSTVFFTVFPEDGGANYNLSIGQ